MWKSTRRWWLISLLLLAPGAVMLSMGLCTPGERAGDGLSYRVLGMVWLAIAAPVSAGLFAYVRVRKMRADRGAQEDIPATATILEAETTGVEMNDMPQVELRLEIALPGQAPYTVNHKSCWSPLSLAGLQPGGRLAVLVDARNRKKIMFVDDVAQ